jgi:RNA ligase
MPAAGSALVSVTQKVDGSLGILFRHDGQYRVATRGSFESEQAQWATHFFNENYASKAKYNIGESWTLLFEIIYPDNRIVINYGDMEALVLLAVRNRHTGAYMRFGEVCKVADSLGMPHADIYTMDNLDDILLTTENIDHEGYVLEYSDGSRFKVKGKKYIALHRIVTKISYNSVLDACLADAWKEYRLMVPEEFWPEIDAYYADITSQVNKAHQAIIEMTDTVIQSFETRKEMAQWVLEKPKHLHRYFFNKYDGKYNPADLFKMINRKSENQQEQAHE